MKELSKARIFDFSLEELQTMLDGALNIDDSSKARLDAELREHSRRHGRWAFLTARANKLLRLAEANLKTVEAEVTQSIRQKYADEKNPLPKTFNVSKELVPLDPRWKDAIRQVIELEEYANVLTSLDRAWGNRAWLLRSLASSDTQDVEPRTYGKRERTDKPIVVEEHEWK